jgi:hypothetical protein
MLSTIGGRRGWPVGQAALRLGVSGGEYYRWIVASERWPKLEAVDQMCGL